jgi:hypothetical protein
MRALGALASDGPRTLTNGQLRSTAGVAVRDALPSELREKFDVWWARLWAPLSAGSGPGALAPVPEIDAWFERTCSGRSP